MYNPHPAGNNRYLYHWLSPQRLETVTKRGVLRPYWRHWIYDLGDFHKGIATSLDPVEWMPREDEGVPAEPCIVIDRLAFEHEAIEIWSAETYHLTRDITAALKRGRDITPILANIPKCRELTFATMDEIFVMSPIPASAVVAIGFEPERMPWHDLEIVREASETWDVPLIQMSGWLGYSPSHNELDALIEDAISNPQQRRYF
mgnify:CR=1 FL=1|jgi:hypothetical protein